MVVGVTEHRIGGREFGHQRTLPLLRDARAYANTSATAPKSCIGTSAPTAASLNIARASGSRSTTGTECFAASSRNLGTIGPEAFAVTTGAGIPCSYRTATAICA